MIWWRLSNNLIGLPWHFSGRFQIYSGSLFKNSSCVSVVCILQIQEICAPKSVWKIPLKTLTFENLAQTGCETAQCSYIFHIFPIFKVLMVLSKSFYDWDCWKNLEEETEGYLDIQYWADFNVKRFPNLPSSSLLTFRGILHQQESKHALLLHLADIYSLQHISPMMIHHMSSYINIRQPISTYVNIYHHIICDIYSNTYQEESNFST